MNFVAVLCSGICPTCLIRVREQLQGNFLMSLNEFPLMSLYTSLLSRIEYPTT